MLYDQCYTRNYESSNISDPLFIFIWKILSEKTFSLNNIFFKPNLSPNLSLQGNLCCSVILKKNLTLFSPKLIWDYNIESILSISFFGKYLQAPKINPSKNVKKNLQILSKFSAIILTSFFAISCSKSKVDFQKNL